MAGATVDTLSFDQVGQPWIGVDQSGFHFLCGVWIHTMPVDDVLDLEAGDVPRQLYLPICRQLVLPIDLLLLAALLGRAGAVAGDVKLQDDGVMDHPVNRRGGGHGVGEDALPLREDQV